MLGSFFTLFINCNPRCSAPENRHFSVRTICFLTLVHLLYYISNHPPFSSVAVVPGMSDYEGLTVIDIC